uniref:Glycerophosphocholine phosphodiesterase n=1 Tax=Schistocephalus solidus TaxID=70667 RepID=A0A183SUH2_SCHSO
LSVGSSAVTGLLCRHTSEKPVITWLVELTLASSSTGAPVKGTSMKLNCPANSIVEAGKQSVKIDDSSNGFLDVLYPACISVYYLAISPTAHDQKAAYQDAACLSKHLDPVNYPGFPLRPVSAQPVSPGEVLLVGHRGLGAETADAPRDCQWPENTLLSFLKAHQLGLPMVELDIQPMRDDSDFVLYHNFNLRTTEVTQSTTHQSSCGCPKYQVDLFDESKVNKRTPNLFPTLSRDDIENILTETHAVDCTHASNVHTGHEALVISALAQTDIGAPLECNRASPLARYLPLFSDMLKLVPNELALDVEVKYPVETPLSAFRLIHEQGQSEDSLAGYGCPYDYFYPINKYADNLLNMLWKLGRNRRIILSSFNPDMCLALKLKQSTYPVLFISRAGLDTSDSIDWAHTLDPRHVSALSSACWAHLANLDGVVLHSCCLQASPSGTDESTRELLSFLSDNRLSCIPYGPGISTADYRKYAARIGLTGVCINDVVDLAKTEDLRWTPAE